MPLYEYLCDVCGYRFEVIQKFSDVHRDTCPECGSAVHKVQSAPAFKLKGTGWYLTDYAKKDRGGPEQGAPEPDKQKPAKDASTSPVKDSAVSASTESKAKSDGGSDSKMTSASDKTSTSAKDAKL